MEISKHGRLRFKQRQNLKNPDQIIRKINLAMSRGNVVELTYKQADIVCYQYAGYRYLINTKMMKLVTTYRANPKPHPKRKTILETLWRREWQDMIRTGMAEAL